MTASRAEAAAPAAPTASRPVLSGVDTLVELLLLRRQLDTRRGLDTGTFVSGYPGSPLGTFDLAIRRLVSDLPNNRIVHRPGLNEELAAAAVWGSQMGRLIETREDGVVGVWYGKSPGVDRSGDSLKHANFMGVGPNGGVVMFVGDDPGPKSSTLPCDSQSALADAAVPVLSPGNVQELIDLGVHAFELSRYCGAWTALRIVTTVADGIGSVDLDVDRHRLEWPPQLADGTIWRHEPAADLVADISEKEFLTLDRRLAAARAYVRHNGLDQVVGAPSRGAVGIVASGKTYYDLVQALADHGIDSNDLARHHVRLLKLAMVYPLVDETVLEFADSVDEVIVIEEKRGFVENQVRAILHENGRLTPVLGKRDRRGATLVPVNGELSANRIAELLLRVLPDVMQPRLDLRTPLPLLSIPARTPAYCSGCPHNRSTVTPADALVGGGVGCHGLVNLEARHRDERKLPPTPMGAEGAPWIGLAPFTDVPHLIQNLGDGTYTHSGSLAVRACVAAGVNVTFKLLYNTAIAMTGGQDVPGLMDVPALTRALEADGVRTIVVCSDDVRRYGRRAKFAAGVQVLDRSKLNEVQQELRSVPGVSVIVYDQRCAAEGRRLRSQGKLPDPPKRVVINDAVCEGCGDCSRKSNCLSVLPVPTEFGQKREIHQSSCNKDYSCLEGDCPSFLTLEPARRRGSRRKRSDRAEVPLPTGHLQPPPPRTLDGTLSVYLTGIGGTGIVTVNRVLARAASLEGLHIVGVDQTGLSQKAGAVVSHLRLARTRAELASSVVEDDAADVYISGDILQAAAAQHLARVHPGRTFVVVEPTLTPTNEMLQSGSWDIDLTPLRETVIARAGGQQGALLDGRAVAEQLLGTHLVANMVMLGAAFQRGAFPLRVESMLTAVSEAGGKPQRNLDAFAWGRWMVQDPNSVAAARDRVVSAPNMWEPTRKAERAASRSCRTAPFRPPSQLWYAGVRRRSSTTKASRSPGSTLSWYARLAPSTRSRSDR